MKFKVISVEKSHHERFKTIDLPLLCHQCDAITGHLGNRMLCTMTLCKTDAKLSR